MTVAGCTGEGKMNANQEETTGSDIDHDPNSEGRAELVWVDVPNQIQAGDALPIRMKAREVTGEGSATIWPTVRMYDVEDELGLDQGAQIKVYANEETVWDEAFLIGTSIHGEEPLAADSGTLLVDIEGNISTVEVVPSDEN